MIQNVEARQDNMKTQEGIGLYKITYEMDLTSNKRDNNYIAGIIAYTSEEAVQTLVKFCKERVDGFKGLRINEVAYEGGCHAVSDSVRNAIIGGAVMEGLVIPKEDHDVLMESAVKETKGKKKSIIPKDNK